MKGRRDASKPRHNSSSRVIDDWSERWLVTKALPLIASQLHHQEIHTYTATTLDATMIAATRRWFRRNRTNLAIGAGVIGVGYIAGQYVLGKISEARQRMSEDRIAKEK